MSIQAAFDKVCTEAKTAEGFYVTLVCDTPFYGGPEEGGWWGSDTTIVAYQHFPTEEQAEAARDAVELLAKEMSEEAKRTSDEACLRQCEWLDKRGLDSDYLPEVRGAESYNVIVSKGIPEPHYGTRHYE